MGLPTIRSLLVVVLLAGFVSCVDRVQLTQLEWDSTRFRRETDSSCPRSLAMKFELHGETAVLNLQKSDINIAQPKLYAFEGDIIKELESSENEKFCVYQDISSKSSMLVNCANGDCKLERVGTKGNNFNLAIIGPDGTVDEHGTFGFKDEMYRMTQSNEPTLAEVEKIEIRENITLESDYFLPEHQYANENQLPTQRRKRAIPPGNIVELLVCTDETEYNFFLDKMGTSDAALAAIKQYFALVINEMDLHYMSVKKSDPSLNIRIYLAGVFVAKESAETPWSINNVKSVNGSTYLASQRALYYFRKWRLANLDRLAKHDFAMAYTRRELAFFKSNGQLRSSCGAGVSYRSSMCTRTAVGIIEDLGERIGHISAHELGHGLGASHDGDSNATSCSKNNRNIMSSDLSYATAYKYASAQWTFSECSVQQFKNYISSLSNNCLANHAFNQTQYDSLRSLPLAGQYYSLDQQCQFVLGLSARACYPRAHEGDCHRGIGCRSNRTAGCFFVIDVFAGTPCGKWSPNKWCLNGLCVARSNDPS